MKNVKFRKYFFFIFVELAPHREMFQIIDIYISLKPFFYMSRTKYLWECR